MDMQNVQAQQTPPSKTTSTTSNTTASASTTNSGGTATQETFVQALIKVIEGQITGEQAEVSTEVMVSIILPPSIVNLVSSQTSGEEIEGAVQALLKAIQSLDPDKLQSFLQQPELQQWMAKAEQLMTLEQSSSFKKLELQEIVTTLTQQTELKAVPTKELITVLNRYLDLLESNPTSPIVQQLGAELKMITTKLSESFPALSAAPGTLVEANKLDGSKTDKVITSTSTNNTQQTQSSSSAQTSGNTSDQQEPKGSQSQLLQRLAYVSPNIKAVMINPSVSNASETPLVSEILTTIVDASSAQQDDVTLTLTQLTDSQKLAATAPEVKPSFHSVSAHEFAEEMTRLLVKNMSINQSNGISEAKISLVPEHLGQVDVRITVINGQITAHFMAESALARDLLELQLPQLRASLLQQGLQVDKLNVEQHNELGSSLFQDQRQQQTSQQFTQNGKKNSKSYDQFGTDFSLEMDQAVRVNRLAYGNTFNATA